MLGAEAFRSGWVGIGRDDAVWVTIGRNDECLMTKERREAGGWRKLSELHNEECRVQIFGISVLPRMSATACDKV